MNWMIFDVLVFSHLPFKFNELITPLPCGNKKFRLNLLCFFNRNLTGSGLKLLFVNH